MRAHKLRSRSSWLPLSIAAVAVSLLGGTATSASASATQHTAAQQTAIVRTVTPAVRRADGTYVAASENGTHVAALRAFDVVETVSGRTGTASMTDTGTISKVQTLAQSEQAGADVTATFARLAVAAGMSASGAASVLGPEVGRAVGKVGRASAPAGIALPSTAASGCGGGDWYVAEQMTQTYTTKSHFLYWYRPETETAYHQHSRTNGNRYLDWSPFTARPSLSGCGSSTIGLTETRSGAGYSQTETYCDGQILPWVRVGTTSLDPYAGSRFQCWRASQSACSSDRRVARRTTSGWSPVA